MLRTSWQVRRDKLYDEIEKIEISIEAVETRLYNIKREKISGDNVYQFLLFFVEAKVVRQNSTDAEVVRK